MAVFFCNKHFFCGCSHARTHACTCSNNTAHSTLGGLWLSASSDAKAAKCTGVDSFTTYLHWDFGVISVKGE